jgi:hypothetical protein
MTNTQHDYAKPNQEMLNALNLHPLLGYAGFHRCKQTRESRDQLMEAGREIDSARAWIKANCLPRKTANRSSGAYGIKHVIERATGDYISEGSSIFAFILEGYRCSVNGPFCHFYFKFKKTK